MPRDEFGHLEHADLLLATSKGYAEAGGAKTSKSGGNEAEGPRDCCSEASRKNQEVKNGSHELRRRVWTIEDHNSSASASSG
jgi:hypothetical protein